MAIRNGFGIIGVGVMGSAIAERVVSTRVVPRQRLVLYDAGRISPDLIRRAGGRVARSLVDVAQSCRTIVICVKPQDARRLAAVLSPYLRQGHLLISIMAGISLRSLGRWFGRRPIIRWMPNTPLRIGEGVTVWMANRFATSRHAAEVTAIVRAFGWSQRVNREAFVDAATVVSGSGPAYVFYLLDLLTRAAISIGLPRRIADRLVVETVRGAASLARSTGLPTHVLRRQVTSKAGTTAAALAVLERARLRGTLERALRSAFRRARSLGKSYG